MCVCDVKLSCFVHIERLFLIILLGSIFQARTSTARSSLKGARSWGLSRQHASLEHAVWVWVLRAGWTVLGSGQSLKSYDDVILMYPIGFIVNLFKERNTQKWCLTAISASPTQLSYHARLLPLLLFLSYLSLLSFKIWKRYIVYEFVYQIKEIRQYYTTCLYCIIHIT